MLAQFILCVEHIFPAIAIVYFEFGTMAAPGFGSAHSLKACLVVRPAWADKIIENLKDLEIRSCDHEKYQNQRIGIAVSGTRSIIGDVLMIGSMQFASKNDMMKPEYQKRHLIDRGMLDPFKYTKYWGWILSCPV